MKNEDLGNIIEQSFRTEPDFRLSSDFAKKISGLVGRKNQLKANLHEYFFLSTVLFFLLAVSSCIYYFVDKETTLKFYTFFEANISFVFLIAFLINFILFADRVLLRLLFRKWN
jgi:hypothetical protein